MFRDRQKTTDAPHRIVFCKSLLITPLSGSLILTGLELQFYQLHTQA
jgi:hypothetical protein